MIETQRKPYLGKKPYPGYKVSFRLDPLDSERYRAIQRILSPVHPEQASDTAVMRKALELAMAYLAIADSLSLSLGAD